jgi:hypothetical protein
MSSDGSQDSSDSLPGTLPAIIDGEPGDLDDDLPDSEMSLFSDTIDMPSSPPFGNTMMALYYPPDVDDFPSSDPYSDPVLQVFSPPRHWRDVAHEPEIVIPTTGWVEPPLVPENLMILPVPGCSYTWKYIGSRAMRLDSHQPGRYYSVGRSRSPPSPTEHSRATSVPLFQALLDTLETVHILSFWAPLHRLGVAAVSLLCAPFFSS